MLDNKINSQDFINFCNETLDISGKIALAHFRDIRDLTIKVDESPVTLADKQIEQVIRREIEKKYPKHNICLLYTSPSPRDRIRSRMPSSA